MLTLNPFLAKSAAGFTTALHGSLIKYKMSVKIIFKCNTFKLLSQPAVALTPSCGVFRGELAYTNFKVFVMTRLGLEHTIHHTRNEHANHYTT